MIRGTNDIFIIWMYNCNVDGVYLAISQPLAQALYHDITKSMFMGKASNMFLNIQVIIFLCQFLDVQLTECMPSTTILKFGWWVEKLALLHLVLWRCIKTTGGDLCAT